LAWIAPQDSNFNPAAHVSCLPSQPAWVEGDKDWEQMRLPLLILHILAGSIGLLSGTVAMALRPE
jgi:hypothetical protein